MIYRKKLFFLFGLYKQFPKSVSLGSCFQLWLRCCPLTQASRCPDIYILQLLWTKDRENGTVDWCCFFTSLYGILSRRNDETCGYDPHKWSNMDLNPQKRDEMMIQMLATPKSSPGTLRAKLLAPYSRSTTWPTGCSLPNDLPFWWLGFQPPKYGCLLL